MTTIKVLIVDDEARIRRGIERLVQSCGEAWEVVATASDGREALDYFGRVDVDLLITDVKMPEMDGLTLIKEAKKRYTFHPLLISGFDDFSYVQTALREGALDYMLKPVDREQFRQRMTEIRDIIAGGRVQSLKQGEMERGAEKLKKSRQIQTLSSIASSKIDVTTLGYWVDEFPKGKYVFQLIKLDTLPVKTRSYTAQDWKAYYYALENILAEVVASQQSESGRQGWSFLGGESDFWALLYGPDEDADLDAAVFELAGKIRTAIQTYTPFSATVAYGDAIEDLYLLPEAKRQAMSLMNYRFLSGGNQVFRPEKKEEERSRGAEDKELSGLFNKLKRAIEQVNGEEAASISKQLFAKLEKMESPEHLHSAVQNTMIMIHSVWLENVNGLVQGASLENELLKARRASSIRELKQVVDRLVESIVHDIGQARQKGSTKPVEQAKKWIGEHLSKDITIKKIADHVFMNPTYFSEYFKMQTGETVLDYLTRQRMDKAKALLAEPVLKLQDICVQIGYQDVKYFSRLFKQHVGQSPSKYREQLLSLMGRESINEDE